MKVNFGFDVKSIEQAIKDITDFKENFKQAKQKFLMRCAEWVRDRSNTYLRSCDIGDALKTEIQAGWVITYAGNFGVMLTNHHEKAVYVEFGVGLDGSQSPHDYAGQAGYAYNVPSSAKRKDGSWAFVVKDGIEYLDLPVSKTQLLEKTSKTAGNYTVAITKGTKGVMYAYNALMDLRLYGAADIWEKEFK